VGAGLVYSIDGVNYQDSVTFSGLTAGTYLVTVMNSDSCISDAVSGVLDSQPPTPDTATLSVIQPSCTVATGTITVIAPVGAGLVYSIDGVNYQDSVRFSGLTAGTYLVTVMNSDSCVSGSVSAVLQSQPPTPIMATANVIHPNCIDSTGTITVTSPLAVGLSYSIDSINFQSGYIFSHIAPGSYSVFVKNLYSCISVPAHAVINPKPFNCSGDIFNTTATCNDFKYAVTGKLHEKLCYMVKSNKVFNVTPGMFFYYALVQAPASSFTINVVQSVNNAAFRLFSVMKDQAILWSDTCTKFIVGKETQTGQTQINVTGAVAGKFYVLSVKYDSKSIIGGVVSGTPIPEYTFFAKVNTVMVPNSSTSISMYPNNCNVVGTSNTGTASSTMMEVEVKRGQVQLYPNPGAGSYTLTVNDFGKGEAVILVMDAYGKMLFTKEVALINGSLVLPLRLQKDAANGIYFVQVTNGDQRKTIRLIKQ
jgi:hypothetical protein